NAVSVEFHFHGLARALSVPDDAGFAVGAHRVDGGADGFSDGEILVGFSDAFGESVAALIEGGEVAHDLQESLGVEDPFDEELQARAQMRIVNSLAELDR